MIKILNTTRTVLVILVITLILFELVLRLLFADLRSTSSGEEDLFWQYSDIVGWEKIPNSSGIYSNGFFRGLVNNDAYGNRKNSVYGTFRKEYRTIFLIGDSTTAALEVNDDQTVPALLEARLRARGEKVNVLNLGVRGFGTDQSVLKALQMSSIISPSEIIYLYVDNDFYNNNTLRDFGRKYGKGVYIRYQNEGDFEAYNYPVPEYPENFAGVISFSKDCTPVPYIIDRSFKGQKPTKKANSLYLTRALEIIFLGLNERATAPGEQPQIYKKYADPYDRYLSGGDKWGNFWVAYLDYGSVRQRCRLYFQDQMFYLLSKLRSIDSLERIGVVVFPDRKYAEMPAYDPEL
jgi:hypothetical protein